ncbi:hypothetical protein C5C18_15000 [Rathayibacter tritici]|nr:SDR family oxidoreductase [Rathayibacter tritici]PPF22223.1 hypothetical protein C5C06_14885 [Rathayibacter tritici]PPF61085.1 hypothetical protein C5C21_15015 [Rathayibacter tritici]PPG02057.1 hypothetical protein C5C18_15000 [Rathayibacter tritici]PPI19125.1 hypothetical protein C5D07_02405 [Rathayibacter tritici]PPI47996.1 hypothetical protein C5D18_02395 [Rathayibacter tritici]
MPYRDGTAPLPPPTRCDQRRNSETKHLEFGPRGVNVNTVAPGATATPGNAAAADALVEMTKGTVAGTPVRPIDIAFAVRFLVSDEASYAHGTVLDIDGGIAHVRLG